MSKYIYDHFREVIGSKSKDYNSVGKIEYLYRILHRISYKNLKISKIISEVLDLMVKIFISHSTKDFHLVEILEKHLVIIGIDVYLAERDYQPGKQLSLKIMQNIDTSDYFLVVYTINGEDSIYVQQEIGYWLGKRGYNDFIPLVAKEINPRAFLRDIEYVELDFFNPNSGTIDVINYVTQKIKAKKKKRIRDIGIGIGIIGLTALILYLLSKLDDE